MMAPLLPSGNAGSPCLPAPGPPDWSVSLWGAGVAVQSTLYSVCCTKKAILSEGLGGTAEVELPFPKPEAGFLYVVQTSNISQQIQYRKRWKQAQPFLLSQTRKK